MTSRGGEPGFKMTPGKEAVCTEDDSGQPLEFENGDMTIDETEIRYPAGSSSAAGAALNFVNTIVGAGIIGLPFALAQSGLWAGILMMCLAAFLNAQSANMLIAVGEKCGRLNYEELMAVVFGKAGTYAFCLFAGILAFGAMSAYLIVVSDTIPEILLASGITTGVLADRHSVLVLFGVFGVLPVSLLRDMSRLAYSSFVSVFSVLLMTAIVVWAGAKVSSERQGPSALEGHPFIQPTIFAGFGAMSFAFVCQQSSFLVYRSMSNRGVQRWNFVTRWSFSVALAMGLTLGIGGFLHFGEETQGNILNNFSINHTFASVARGFLAVAMTLTYPLEMYVARHVLDVAVFQTVLEKGPTTWARHYCVTISIWALTMVLALSTDDLGNILEIFGAFSSTVVGYILPALLYMSSSREDLRAAAAAWRKDSAEYEPFLGRRLSATRKFALPAFMVVFGVVAMVAGVATAILHDLTPTKA